MQNASVSGGKMDELFKQYKESGDIALRNKIAEKYPLTEFPVGDMANLKASGMKFIVEAYKAEGLGHVSVMRANGFFGLMKMDTLIINPTELDLPLYSYDRIFAMGQDTLIVELYDTNLKAGDLSLLEEVKKEYENLPERDPGVHWYDSIKLKESISKKGKKAQTKGLDELTEKHFDAYLSTPAEVVTDKEAKLEKASYYVEGLLEKGGPSTDVFKKSLGVEKTTTLFKKYLFGI